MVAAGVAIAALIVGCGEVSGTAQPVSNELFDPCAVVPDEAIRAAGADPAVVSDSLIGERANQTSDVCIWAAETYYLTVLSSVESQGTVIDDPRYESRRMVELPGRPTAYELRRPDPIGTAPCDISFPWSRGMVIVNVESKASSAGVIDNCSRAISAASVLSPTLPR
ncbi:DUF3558 family protein [Rhodococcus sp. MEB064]|uniref:DUF3558 family protein n=1 Tax=Rhodococcus sp. MEB064 TaxID=1587522 RepID=UPI0005ACB045|nr:DUF3558 family protein [Rhodococcus sp. MEB064]